jgi:uncharacterized protein (TIGR03435 family)
MKAFRLFPVTFLLLAASALPAADATPVRAQFRPGHPSVGDPAPPLRLARVFGGPPAGQTSWAALRGDVVVVEFWATWCAPCVEAIPHLNRLAGEFAGQGVRFVSITDEKAEVVRKFLATHPIRGWVGLDENRATTREYRVAYIPLTVIVDRDGRIAGLTRPVHLTETVLREALAGEHPKLPPLMDATGAIEAGSEPTEFAPREDSLFFIDIRPDANPVGGLAINRDRSRVTAVAWPARALVSALLQIPEDRILGSEWLPKGRYTVVARAPAVDGAELQAEIERAVEMSWGVRVRHERRTMDAYLLTAPRGIKRELGPASAEAGWKSAPGRLDARKEPLAALAKRLEQKLQRPVLDETHLAGDYDFTLSYNGNDSKAVIDAVGRLGLELKPARRKVDVLVIEKR